VQERGNTTQYQKRGDMTLLCKKKRERGGWGMATKSIKDRSVPNTTGEKEILGNQREKKGASKSGNKKKVPWVSSKV